VRVGCGEELWYIIPKADRVTVHIAVVCHNRDNALIVRALLREFGTAHAQSKARGAIPHYWGSELPRELQQQWPKDCRGQEAVGAHEAVPTSYFSWNFLESHVGTGEEIATAVELVLGFRRFISYHITSAKAHMQAVMRQRTDHYSKVLKRGERKDLADTSVWYKRGMGTIGGRGEYGASVTQKPKGFWDSDSDEAVALEPVQ
jgi:hypothetical protein